MNKLDKIMISFCVSVAIVLAFAVKQMIPAQEMMFFLAPVSIVYAIIMVTTSNKEQKVRVKRLLLWYDDNKHRTLQDLAENESFAHVYLGGIRDIKHCVNKRGKNERT